MKRAFTLAEILIVLVLIGVLTAILLPVAFQSAPNEAVIKFKKGHNTLITAIKELVNSDKYYLEGYLGEKSDGTRISSGESADTATDDEDYSQNRKYFCNTLAEILTTKSINCSDASTSGIGGYLLLSGDTTTGTPASSYTVNQTTIAAAKDNLDEQCKNAASVIGAEITLPDNTIYYQTRPGYTFGVQKLSPAGGGNVFSKPNEIPIFKDQNGFDIAYKIFCMDIDGINKGEDPFGYGIRGDGKVLAGTRAQEWFNKSIQKGDN